MFTQIIVKKSKTANETSRTFKINFSTHTSGYFRLAAPQKVPGEPEVAQLGDEQVVGVAVGRQGLVEYDVLALDVAVADSPAVQVRHRAANVRGDETGSPLTHGAI